MVRTCTPSADLLIVPGGQAFESRGRWRSSPTGCGVITWFCTHRDGLHGAYALAEAGLVDGRTIARTGRTRTTCNADTKVNVNADALFLKDGRVCPAV